MSSNMKTQIWKAQLLLRSTRIWPLLGGEMSFLAGQLLHGCTTDCLCPCTYPRHLRYDTQVSPLQTMKLNLTRRLPARPCWNSLFSCRFKLNSWRNHSDQRRKEEDRWAKVLKLVEGWHPQSRRTQWGQLGGQKPADLERRHGRFQFRLSVLAPLAWQTPLRPA